LPPAGSCPRPFTFTAGQRLWGVAALAFVFVALVGSLFSLFSSLFIYSFNPCSCWLFFPLLLFWCSHYYIGSVSAGSVSFERVLFGRFMFHLIDGILLVCLPCAVFVNCGSKFACVYLHCVPHVCLFCL
jgi:hypothetical protein